MGKITKYNFWYGWENIIYFQGSKRELINRLKNKRSPNWEGSIRITDIEQDQEIEFDELFTQEEQDECFNIIRNDN